LEFEEEKHQSPEKYYRGLLELAKQNAGKIVAIGECGLG